MTCGDGPPFLCGRLCTSSTWPAHSGNFCLKRPLDIAEVCFPHQTSSVEARLGASSEPLRKVKGGTVMPHHSGMAPPNLVGATCYFLGVTNTFTGPVPLLL